MTNELPGPFSYIPEDPEEWARVVWKVAGPRLSKICKAFRARVVYLPRKDFDPDEAGTPALLIPSEEGGFIVLVASAAAPRGSALARKYIAHEISHMLFYDYRNEGLPPRVAPYPPTPKEERFCDAFAKELVSLQP